MNRGTYVQQDKEKMANFLTPFESRRIQGIFEKWLETLKPDAISLQLFQANLISRYEHEKYVVIKTPTEKASFIFQNVLLKATYDDVCRIRDILLRSSISGHKLLAKLLPDRGEPIDFDKYDFPITASYVTQPQDAPQNKQDNDIEMREEKGDYDDDDDILDLEGAEGEEYGDFINIHLPEGSLPSSQLTEAIAQNAGGKKPTTLRIRKKDIKFTDPIIKSAANADYTQLKNMKMKGFTPKLSCYDVKPQNRKHQHRNQFGKGLCVIFRNFTGDLLGYAADEARIKDFFKEKLGYEVWCGDNVYNFTNLCKEEFTTTLKQVQEYLRNPFSCSEIDRFFMFILSHGDEYGIKFCAKGSDRNEEKVDGEPTRMPVDDIVKMFTHDKVPLLKGYPKCFLVQACQGTEVAKPAADPQSNEYEDKKRIDELMKKTRNLWQPPKIPTAIGADILVCLPSEKGTYSWVPSTGSWFIGEVIALFDALHHNEHVVDMMVQVNNSVSTRKGKGQIGDSSSDIVDVVQMPVLSCTLTKKFYLRIPQCPPFIDK